MQILSDSYVIGLYAKQVSMHTIGSIRSDIRYMKNDMTILVNIKATLRVSSLLQIISSG